MSRSLPFIRRCRFPLAAILMAAGLAQAGVVPAYITAAVDNGSRPEKDRDRDANRKPGLVLAFAGVKPGMKVAELMPGGGYFSRLFCQIVGPRGHLYAISINRTIKRDPPPPDAAAQPPPPPNPCTNISADSQDASALKLPPGLDMVWTSENYHDLHNDYFGKPDMKAFNRAVFEALKPGGIYMVEDHVAAGGSGARDTPTLHRIDPELVKQEVTSAGFEFVLGSDVLHNAEDMHDAKVFDLKGRSDKFLFKFRKPRSAH
jgi:predicted methyltransferase